MLPPATSQDKEALGDELIKESPSTQLREIDLNNWLDGYIKYLSTLSIFDTPQDSETFANFKSEIIGHTKATTNSKKFGENIYATEDCPDGSIFSYGCAKDFKIFRSVQRDSG